MASRGGAGVAHHDGAHRVAERGAHGGLGARLDLEVVDERAQDTADGVELTDRGLGARGAQLALERVGAGAGAGGVPLGVPPALLGGAQRVLGRGNGLERLRAGQGELGGVERREVVAQRHRVGDEGLDDAGVGGARQLALEAASLLGEKRGEAAAALAQRLHARDPLGEALDAEHREGRLGADDGVVELGEARVQLGVALTEGLVLVAQARQARLEPGELVADEIEAQGPQLVDDRAVALRGPGLTFERRELPPHLPEQVLEAHQVRLGGDEAALGPLLAAPELQDPRRLLDDRPPVVGRRREDRVELALPDDHVLLAADPGVGQQLLEVEEPTGDAVQLVLGFTGAEQAAGDRHLAELDRQEMRRVVDRERHLGAAERRAAGRAGEDHVVHPRAAQRARPLRAEHPRDGVDEVRLARAVRADDDGDARLEVQRRLVGERLEAPQGQGLQEHLAAPSLSRIVATPSCPSGERAAAGDPVHAAPGAPVAGRRAQASPKPATPVVGLVATLDAVDAGLRRAERGTRPRRPRPRRGTLRGRRRRARRRGCGRTRRRRGGPPRRGSGRGTRPPGPARRSRGGGGPGRSRQTWQASQ